MPFCLSREIKIISIATFAVPIIHTLFIFIHSFIHSHQLIYFPTKELQTFYISQHVPVSNHFHINITILNPLTLFICTVYSVYMQLYWLQLFCNYAWLLLYVVCCTAILCCQLIGSVLLFMFGYVKHNPVHIYHYIGRFGHEKSSKFSSTPMKSSFHMQVMPTK